MPRTRATIALLASLLTLGCAPEPPSRAAVARAELRVGEELELGPLEGTDFEGMSGFPTPSLFCDQRDACVVLGMEYPESLIEILSFPMRHDGTPTGPAHVVASSRFGGFEGLLAVAGTEGFAVSYYGTSDLDPWRWRRWLQLLGPDGRPRGEPITLVEHADSSIPYAALYFDGRAYVAAIIDAEGAVTMIRVDPATGRELDRSPLPEAIWDVTCGPVACIAAAGDHTLLFRRDESPARARTLPITPGTFAASRNGFAVWRWDDSEIEWLAVDGTSTGRTPATRHMTVASGGETILVHGVTDAGLVVAEVDPRAAPAALTLQSFAGWWTGVSPAWSGAHWLISYLGPHVRASWHWDEPDWMRVAPGSLEIEQRFEGEEDVRAPAHTALAFASDVDGYVAAWRETEDRYSQERVRIVRIAPDGAVTASTAIEGASRPSLAIGGGVVAVVSTEYDAATGGRDTLRRFDRSLRPMGGAVVLPMFSEIAWDGERFVAGARDALARHSPDPTVPPIAMPSPSIWPSSPGPRLASIENGVLVVAPTIAGSVLARWDRALGWRDGAGVAVEGRVGAVAARGSTVAMWTSRQDAAGTWWARLWTVDTSADVLSMRAGDELEEGLFAIGVAARGRGWIVLAHDDHERAEHSLYGIEVDESLVPRAPFVVQPLVWWSQVNGGIGCGPAGDCYAAYDRWIAEEPYRNQRARGRLLFAAPEGVRCGADHECASGHCVDGVCCDDACGGGDPDDCLACSAAAGAALDGRCAPRAPAAACGGPDCAGTCDGAGACDLACDAGVDGGGEDGGTRDGGPTDAGAPGPGADAGAVDAAPRPGTDGGSGAPDAGVAESPAGCACRAGHGSSAPWAWLAAIAGVLAGRRLRRERAIRPHSSCITSPSSIGTSRRAIALSGAHQKQWHASSSA